MSDTKAPDGATLHAIAITVCSLCLDGAGGECHVPGCVFVFGDAPLPRSEGLTLREKLVGVGSIDGVTAYPTLTKAHWRGTHE